MKKYAAFVLAVLALLVGACSGSPTAPTPVDPEPVIPQDPIGPKVEVVLTAAEKAWVYRRRLEDGPEDPGTENRPFAIIRLNLGTSQVAFCTMDKVAENEFACMKDITLTSNTLYTTQVSDPAFGSTVLASRGRDITLLGLLLTHVDLETFPNIGQRSRFYVDEGKNIHEW